MTALVATVANFYVETRQAFRVSLDARRLESESALEDQGFVRAALLSLENLNPTKNPMTEFLWRHVILRFGQTGFIPKAQVPFFWPSVAPI